MNTSKSSLPASNELSRCLSQWQSILATGVLLGGSGFSDSWWRPEGIHLLKHGNLLCTPEVATSMRRVAAVVPIQLVLFNL